VFKWSREWARVKENKIILYPFWMCSTCRCVCVWYTLFTSFKSFSSWFFSFFLSYLWSSLLPLVLIFIFVSILLGGYIACIKSSSILRPGRRATFIWQCNVKI
jgi:hypothetical protein